MRRTSRVRAVERGAAAVARDEAEQVEPAERDADSSAAAEDALEAEARDERLCALEAAALGEIGVPAAVGGRVLRRIVSTAYAHR
jgi:hypothetical protein